MRKALWTNICFEFTSRKRFLSPYLFWLLMSTLCFLMVLASGGAFKEAAVSFGLGQKVAINSPIAIHLYYSLLVLFGILIISPIFGQAACKDYENKFDGIIFATPSHRSGFLLGRFAGASLFSLAVLSGLGVGMYLATASPWIQKSLFIENRLDAYILPYLTVVLPNIIIFGSIFFAVGTVTRRMAPVYVAGILCFMANLFGNVFSSEIEHIALRALVDPFGINAVGVVTRYWSVAEQNERLITLAGYFLWNRLLWLGLGLLVLAASIALAQQSRKTKAVGKEKRQETVDARAFAPASAVSFPQSRLDFRPGARARLFAAQALFEFRSALKNIYFICLTLAGIIFVLSSSATMGKMFGTETYPVTWKILQAASGSFKIFVDIIIIFYTGELIWRDRTNRLNQILDALPTPNWLTSLAKFVALQLVTIVLLLIIASLSVLIQLSQGYTKFELGQVFYTLFTMDWPNYAILSALFFLIHTAVNNKYVGHGLSILFMIVIIFMSGLGFDRVLYIYGAGTGAVTYSDMNGYGSFLYRTRQLQLYWGLCALNFLVLVFLLWVRGTDVSWSLRLREAKTRLRWPLGVGLSLLFAAFVAQGVFVYYNTSVLNPYKSEREKNEDRVYYETTYKAAYDRKPQLSIVSVKADIDLYPTDSAMKAKVRYGFENRSGEPLNELFVVLPSPKETFAFHFDRDAELVKDDSRVDLLIYKFLKPIAPGESLSLVVDLDRKDVGFSNDSGQKFLVGNGTFFNNHEPFPSFGYSDGFELSTDKTREKFGLAPKPRMNPITDEAAKAFNYLTGREGDWIDFEATVSTDPDQIAIAPGYLQKEWQDAGRRYFRYTMDQKILNFFSVLSARYEKVEDKWNGVALEVYYHKGHEYNIRSMLDASKHGLDYFTKNFGPYQHRQFRIVEFPRYSVFAQSFPNTIPYSEAIGFIAKVDPKQEDDIDYPYYVTAHELAHQWWGHQVVGADVQGATVLSETLSQYSALMVMEQKFGRAKMGRFLKHELDDYLRSRSTEVKLEQPLALNEGQGYIHYNKGSLVMYALKEVVGEEKLNLALRTFLNRYKYQKPPFTTSLEFVATLKEVLGPAHAELIDDLMTRITLYDNRLVSGDVKALEGGFELSLKVKGRKTYTDDKGVETDAPLDQDFVLSIQDKDGKTIETATRRLKGGDNALTFKLPIRPAKVQLDELGIWIDKDRSDNKLAL